VYSQATLTIYSNKNNPNFRVKMFDVFPTTVGSIIFNTGDSSENIVVADATFRFSYYNYERI
jgi:translation elongation factor P/translation initiation factor 5A